MNAADEISARCLAVRLRMLNRALTGLFDDALRPLGLRTTQLNILVVVSRMGDATASRVAAFLHLDKSSISREVRVLVRNKWLSEAKGTDGRRRHLSTSALGERLIARALPAWRAAQSRAEDMLGPAGTSAVHSLADRLWSTV